MAQATCDECGTALTGRQRRFCSRLHARRVNKREAWAKGLEWATRRHTTTLTCGWCGKGFEGEPAKQDAEHLRRYCSAKCVAEGLNWHKREVFSIPIPWACRLSDRQWYRVDTRRRPEPRSQGPCCRLSAAPYKHRRIAGLCTECKQPFVGRWHPLWPCRYCSDTCIDRVARRKFRARHGRLDQARKRARFYGVAYEPISRNTVLKRDGYRCQLCGVKTPARLKVPDPHAPTVDHIIPVSQGGPHLYSNVQCACFACNVKKGDGAANDQLRIDV